MPSPNLLGRTASLALDLGPPEFPTALRVEIVACDAPLTATDLARLEGCKASGRRGAFRRDELLDSNPPPSEGEVLWYTGTEGTAALAALSRLSVSAQPNRLWPGFLLDLLTSPEALVPVLPSGKPASGWVTLEPTLRNASVLAVAPVVPTAGRQPLWTLVASRSSGLILVRTVEPEEATPRLAEATAVEIRRALGL
jgi:hypothetical protein